VNLADWLLEQIAADEEVEIARVLAESAMRRRIVEFYETDSTFPPAQTLGLFAQPYRDRAGYRQEWDVQ
jgi:hypothetical protein